MAAVLEPNEDGSWSAIIEETDTDVTDLTGEKAIEASQEAAELVDQEVDTEESEDDLEDGVQDSEDILDSVLSDSVEDSEEVQVDSDGVSSDNTIALTSAAASSSSFTPAAWQINLASARQLGEHYLMWAERYYYSGTSYYTIYYLAVGRDITFDDSTDLYTYSDVDLYDYYSYNSVITYERDIASGDVSGSDCVVYSDLYFDYVGVNPVNNSDSYISFVLLLCIIIILVVGVRRNV